MREIFRDRQDAGLQLAARLDGVRGENVVVLGLPRGGVPVATEVAATLGVPLGVILVRKLGVPFQPELAMGAIGEHEVKVLDGDLIERFGIRPAQVEAVERRERRTLEERARLFRSGVEGRNLIGRTAIIVDDGIATGATASAACAVARDLGATRVIVAAPVGSPDSVRRVRGADEMVCPVQPVGFAAVCDYYLDFRQTTDAEVIELLDTARRRTLGPG